MGRRRIKPLSYEQITAQAEKTITLIMQAAHIETNSIATKEQCASRAYGALLLWRSLTISYGDTADDEEKFVDLLRYERD